MEEDERITIVIKEIDYWKKHKLLPEQYCDFLLALYTKGEEYAIPNKKTSVKNASHSFITVIVLLILSLLLPFSFLVLYFTEFHVYLQLAILTFFFCVSFLSFLFSKPRRGIVFQISLIVCFLLALLISIQLGQLLLSNIILLNSIVILNFIVWIIVSRLFGIQYLFISGLIGIIFDLIYVIISI